MTDNTEGLLPCPFCGGEGLTHRASSDKLGWLQGNRNLPVCYLGWHVADAATDMLKRAYPELALAANGSATDAD